MRDLRMTSHLAKYSGVSFGAFSGRPSRPSSTNTGRGGGTAPRVPAADGDAAGGGTAARPPLVWPNGSIGEYTPVKSGGDVPCARSDAVDMNSTHRSADVDRATVFDMMVVLAEAEASALRVTCDYWAAGACCCPTTLPSARLTRVRRPVRLPSFAGLKSTVIVSPILRVVLDQPARTN